MVPKYEPNKSGLEKLKVSMVHCANETVADVYRVLRVSGQEYKRQIQRVVPVEFGTLKNSWQMVASNNGEEIIIEVGTNLVSDTGKPYPVYLEFGTDRIAGGRVQEWKPGDNPILEWPAKLNDIPNFRPDAKGLKGFAGSDGTKKFERSVKTAQRQFTIGEGEQMPFLRPLGYELAPRVLNVMQIAVSHGIKEAMNGKHF